jgi:hypothetical protein
MLHFQQVMLGIVGPTPMTKSTQLILLMRGRGLEFSPVLIGRLVKDSRRLCHADLQVLTHLMFNMQSISRE